MKLQKRVKKGKAAARGAAGIASLYWKCRHPPRRKRKELEVPDKQLDNDKTGNSTADDSAPQAGKSRSIKATGPQKTRVGTKRKR